MMPYDEQQPVQETTSTDAPERLPTSGEAENAMDESPGVSALTTASESAKATPAAAETVAADTNAPSQASEPPSKPRPQEEDISMEEALEQSFRSFEEGEIVRATVVQVDREGALVDVGTKTEVRIPLPELSQEPISSASEVVQVGDEIEVMVVRPRGEEGGPVLSKRLADFERLWQSIVEAYERQETLEAMVTERVKGGVVVDIGVRCFVPASLIARKIPPQQLDRLIGETLPIKIIDLDHEKRKAVASNIAAEEERRRQREQAEREQRERIFSQLQVGQRLKGKVKRFTGYGAFVDIGGYEGLLHVSEISWTRIGHPREALKIGEEIEVVVIRLEPDRGKVALSRRQVLPDPWSEVAQHYREGETLELPISRVERTGAFAKLPEGIEAFIPLSELTSKRGVRSAQEVVSQGETVKARIIEIDPRRRRMVLSVRAVEDQRAMQEHARQRAAQGGRSTGFTIAERLQSQLQELQQSLTAEPSSDSPSETPAQTVESADAEKPAPIATEEQESRTQAGIEEQAGEQEATNAE
ncbi:30S ribosomal protein S1 [bacterium HR15]|nr:30S ribosomal protein S1 [bacterium HR15]